MSIKSNQSQKRVYGFNNPLQKISPLPIIALVDPTSENHAELGTEWIKEATGIVWMLAAINGTGARWTRVGTDGQSLIRTVQGNSGGPVQSNAQGVLSVVGVGGTIVTGNPSTNTVSIMASGATSESTTLVSVTPYVVQLTDGLLLVQTATIGTSIIIKLPDAPPVDGQSWVVKDIQNL